MPLLPASLANNLHLCKIPAKLLQHYPISLVILVGLKYNIFFLGMVRNPYAHVEGLIRRNGATTEFAAAFALRCLRYQKQNKENEKNSLFISYEELCDNKSESIAKIESFMPELGSLNSDLEFSAHNFKTDGKMKIQNLNPEKIKKLSSEQLQVINSYFKKEAELLEYFGYSVIE